MSRESFWSDFESVAPVSLACLGATAIVLQGYGILLVDPAVCRALSRNSPKSFHRYHLASASGAGHAVEAGAVVPQDLPAR